MIKSLDGRRRRILVVPLFISLRSFLCTVSSSKLYTSHPFLHWTFTLLPLVYKVGSDPWLEISSDLLKLLKTFQTLVIQPISSLGTSQLQIKMAKFITLFALFAIFAVAMAAPAAEEKKDLQTASGIGLGYYGLGYGLGGYGLGLGYGLGYGHGFYGGYGLGGYGFYG